MEIRQLKYFVGIVETGSFSEASRKFYLSQSAISQQIKALEDELKVSLFNRTSHSLSLTEAGQTFLPLATRVLNSVDKCREGMNELGTDLAGELNIGLTYSMEHHVRNTSVEFMKLHPHVKLNVYFKTTPELMRMLREQKLDFVLSVSADGCDDLYESVPVARHYLCAIMRSTNPLAHKSEVCLTELEHQNLVLPERTEFINSVAGRYLNYDACRLNVRATVNAPCSILNFVRQTDFISILPAYDVQGQKDFSAVRIKELSEPVVSYVHTLKGCYRKRSTEEFIRLMREEIKRDEFLKTL